MPLDHTSGVYYELTGSGSPLLLGFPLMASQEEIFGPEAGGLTGAFIERLAHKHRLLFMDYPGIGRSADIPTDQLTAAQVCADILAVADAAGFDRFSYWGYSWGAAVGLQLAWRTDRLSALVIGGWPPLGGQYVDMLKASLEQVDDPPPEVQVVLRSPAQYRQWSTFYASVQDWPERLAVESLQCPRLAYAGGEGDVSAGKEWIRNAGILNEKRVLLEQMGWRVVLVPGRNHATCLDAEVVVPMLESVLGDI